MRLGLPSRLREQLPQVELLHAEGEVGSLLELAKAELLPVVLQREQAGLLVGTESLAVPAHPLGDFRVGPELHREGLHQCDRTMVLEQVDEAGGRKQPQFIAAMGRLDLDGREQEDVIAEAGSQRADALDGFGNILVVVTEPFVELPQPAIDVEDVIGRYADSQGAVDFDQIGEYLAYYRSVVVLIDAVDLSFYRNDVTIRLEIEAAIGGTGFFHCDGQIIRNVPASWRLDQVGGFGDFLLSLFGHNTTPWVSGPCAGTLY